MTKILKISFYLILLVAISSCSGEIKEITEKYPDGSPKVVTYFIKKNDVKIKVREIGYYQNKNESYKGGFKDGVRAGKWEYWYENGKLFASTEVTNSIATQKWQILKPDQTPYYDESHQLAVVEIYPNGSPYHCIYSKPNDILRKELFFYPSYTIQMQGSSANNLRQGNWNYWYENGNRWSEGYFIDGENDSIRNVWYENGNKRYEGFYKNGKEAGIWKFYDEKGILVKEVDYNKIKSQK